jgi:spermidine synthase
VRDSGEKIVESRVDLAAPHRLVLHYTRLMMTGLLYCTPHPPRRALLIGLGGGGMVHFLNRVFPAIQLDVVELQPRIIRLAREAFGVRPPMIGPNTRIMQADGGSFVAQQPGAQYDLVFVDGFLHPGTPGTDPSGVPANLKGADFLRKLVRILQPGGVVVFNLNEGSHTPSDTALLKQTFANVQFLRHNGNLIVVCPREMPNRPELQKRAAKLDQSMPRDSTFFFVDLV